ncbi:MAG: hypothetical protein MUE59_02710 [Thiobacillaceae bacterium]|nr:hypothetical protein [Thiobacillaceae bacterium]
MSKFIVDADDMEWGAVTPAIADEVELLELALILFRRNKPEAERLALMAAEGTGTRGEVLRAYRDAVARLPTIH